MKRMSTHETITRLSVYDEKPARLLTELSLDLEMAPQLGAYCAGFECEIWRCNQLADHLMDWLADYALREEELRVSHTNMYVRLREAAVRIYDTEKHERRGELGEILLHAICRDFFGTIPFAPRVFYLTSSNDVVKSFDMVHVRYMDGDAVELWLGEAKFYKEADDAIRAAIISVKTHIDQGFLSREKLILGPQVSTSIPHFQKIRELLSAQTSLDALFASAVFPICIACDSDTTASSKGHSKAYTQAVVEELSQLKQKVATSGLLQKIRIILIYLPLGSKEALADAFDERLKGVLP